MSLTPAQRQFYDDNGYVVVHNLIPQPILRQLRDRISEIVENVSRDRNARVPGTPQDEPGEGESAAATATLTKKPPLRKLSELAPADEFFRSVVMLPQILDIATELTGSTGPLKLYADQAFLKPAFEG